MGRTRTFLGVGVSGDTRTAAVTLQQALGRCGATAEWVPRDNLHVTLLFLGEVDDRDLAGVCRSVVAVAAREPAFELHVSGVGGFPTLRRPKTVWAGVAEGAAELARLHAALEGPLLESGAYRREDRAYTPHLTLGRVRAEEDSQLLAAELPRHRAWSCGRTTVSDVLVYASDLRRGGPTYTVVGRGTLGGRG